MGAIRNEFLDVVGLPPRLHDDFHAGLPARQCVANARRSGYMRGAGTRRGGLSGSLCPASLAPRAGGTASIPSSSDSETSHDEATATAQAPSRVMLLIQVKECATTLGALGLHLGRGHNAG